MKKYVSVVLSLIFAVSTGAVELGNSWKSLNPAGTVLEKKEGQLHLVIRAETKFHGGAVLNFEKLEGETNYLFSATLTADQPDLAYLSVKLYRKGEELKRFDSPCNGKTPSRLSVKFNTEKADRVELLIRTIQTTKTIGAALTAERISLEKGE